MAETFKWIRPGYELVEAKFEWNVQLPFLQNRNGNDGYLKSPLFPTPDTPNSTCDMQVQDSAEKIIIFVLHYSELGGEEVSELGGEQEDNFIEPVLVKMSILNKKGTKVFQQMLSSNPDHNWVKFNLSKEEIIQSKCQQSDGSLTFNCKIFTHKIKESVSSSADPPVLAVNCRCRLSTHLCGLFNNMQFSDINFNIRGREFPAHKNILAARSEVFEAMFKHPMKEQSTNQIEIEDIEPEVFQELLRFIYTGRVSTATIEKMAAKLFIAADKYLLDDLKIKCANYMLSQISPDYCLVLLLHGNLLNPAEPYKKAAKFLRRFPNQVMATDGWKKIKKENPALLCEIQQFVLCLK